MTNKKILITTVLVAVLIMMIGIGAYYYWLKNYRENKVKPTEQERLNTLNQLRSESTVPSPSTEEQGLILGGLNDSKDTNDISKAEKLKILESLGQ